MFGVASCTRGWDFGAGVTVLTCLDAIMAMDCCCADCRRRPLKPAWKPWKPTMRDSMLCAMRGDVSESRCTSTTLPEREVRITNSAVKTEEGIGVLVEGVRGVCLFVCRPLRVELVAIVSSSL